MLRFLHRLIAFLSRLLVAVHRFGVRGAMEVFVWSRWQTEDRLSHVWLRQQGRPFWFRRSSDRGVVCSLVEESYRVADCYQRRVEVIIDAGANIGDSTLRFRRFHPHAKIFALEADGDNFALLQKNFVDDRQVECLHRALWFESGTVHVRKTWANIASRVDQAASLQSAPVQACSVPSLMKEFGIDEIDILKLDIEGAEKLVFQTQDRAWLGKVRCIVFECCDADDPGTTMAIFREWIASQLDLNCYLSGECILAVRQDTPWFIVQDLWWDEKASVMPHIESRMAEQGQERLD